MPLPEHAGPFAKHLGVASATPIPGGGLEIVMEVDERHHNAGGVVHGGVVMAILDMAMGGASALTCAAGEWTATQSMTTDFMRPIVKGRLTARGVVERKGKLTTYPRGELYDEKGDLVARATGVWAIRKG